MSTLYRRLFSAFLIIFAAGLIITIPLAVCLILYSIDPSTHFYYDNAKYVSLTNFILIILTVILIIPAFFKNAGSVRSYAASRRPVLAAFSAIMAAALCVVSVYDISNIVSNRSGAGNFLTGLTGMLAAVFFVMLAFNAFTGKNIDMRMAALFPVLWGVVNLISTFMSLTQIANISEYLYEVIQMVFAILFLYYNARLVGDVPNGHEINGVFAFGLPCAFFGLLTSVPPVIAHFINAGRGNLPQVQYANYLALSLYILVLLVSLLADKQQTLPAQKNE